MISSHISRASAVVLALGGFALQFASDAILPRAIPGFPPAAAWVGQLLGAAWLALAVLDWLGRSALLGGIYARGQVSANAVVFFVSAMTLVRVVARTGAPLLAWVAFVVAAAFALVYGWLMFRGPFERDLQSYRQANQAA